ncbi:MAG TPA: PLP-dependent aminotransferase family protein [Sedimentisphaerales bacterium]|jgi:2-aminoadipate transaminase|nr:PLP-dependent aminotransferase family protein [Sedimentisphaerales bacterium]HNU30434.1 PLP-dependent aminotransferase family protein [Sedimentisphaerales bacterium]
MSPLYASRMGTIPRSFVREILKVTQNSEIISFAGGLPNPRLFPVQEIAEAAVNALAGTDGSSLQYGPTEGYTPLREYIAQRYRRNGGLNVTADEILITNGSQQGLDLIGKAFINRQDAIAIEQPGYLGAIQAFSAYEPQFHAVPLLEDGVDIERLTEVLQMHRVKFFHTVINFQNPSGISYSEGKRAALAGVLQRCDTLVVEDDPYKELCFEGEARPSMRKWLGDRAVLLGSFSKIVAPGLRMGWVCAAREILEKLIVAKQASDLHSNSFCQQMLYQYLVRHDIDLHIATLRAAYKRQKDAMLAAIDAHFPAEVHVTHPEGGMFVWATLPPRLSAMELFEHAAREKVVFVPGRPFFVDGGGTHNMRLNFSNADEDKIEEGIARLGRTITKLLNRTGGSPWKD